MQIKRLEGRFCLRLLSSLSASCWCCWLLFRLPGSLPQFSLCCRSSDEAAAEGFSSPWPAAQAPQQPWRQPLLQPAKCEFKVPIKAFVWVWFHMIIQLNLPVPDPGAPPPRSSASCLEHVLMLFICCFHVRMSAFTVNNWCGLSKPSKMHASSDSLEPFDQKKNYAVTSDIISICSHSTQNHFELKINDSLLVFWLCALGPFLRELWITRGARGSRENLGK